MLRSFPARSTIVWSAAAVSGDPATFVTASVGQPCRRPSSTTAMRSGDSPDCEMPTTSAPVITGGVW